MSEVRPDLSAIVLCYRAGESVKQVVEPLYKQLSEDGLRFELVLVANSDEEHPDPTAPIVQDFASRHEHVRPVVGPKKGAMGWDMRSGLEAAHGATMVVIDGDAQNPVEDVLRMYREMAATGADVMKGRREARYDGAYRRFISTMFNLFFRLVFRTRGVWDINAKPKGLTRAAYEQMELTSDDWFIDAEIVLAAQAKGLEIGELPVVFRSNEERASFVGVDAIWEFLRNMARVWLRRTPRP